MKRVSFHCAYILYSFSQSMRLGNENPVFQSCYFTDSMRLLQARATADLHIFVWICSFVFIKGKSRKNSNNSSLKTFPPLLNKSMRQYNKDACLIYFNRTKYGNWDREAKFPIVASENLHFWNPFEEFTHYIFSSFSVL